MPAGNKRITVLGLGNILCGDDGLGVHAVEKLYSQYDFPSNVQLVDGGAQGPALYGIVAETDKLLLFDALDLGVEPGSMAIRDKKDIPLWLGARKISPHQNSFAEVLACAELKNVLPAEICLVGLQPQNTRFGAPISSVILKQMENVIKIALNQLTLWGVTARPSRTGKSLLNSEIRKVLACQ